MKLRIEKMKLKVRLMSKFRLSRAKRKAKLRRLSRKKKL